MSLKFATIFVHLKFLHVTASLQNLMARYYSETHFLQKMLNGKTIHFQYCKLDLQCWGLFVRVAADLHILSIYSNLGINQG